MSTKKNNLIKGYDVLRYLHFTEKSSLLNEQGKIVFVVDPAATKKDVKKAVEDIFSVNVLAVNTIKLPGKKKVFRGRFGVRQGLKKAIITLAEGQAVNLLAGV